MVLLMLGEQFILSSLNFYSNVSSQESWIQQMSFRDNILFGKVYSEQWYKKVIHTCALENDIKVNLIYRCWILSIEEYCRI